MRKPFIPAILAGLVVVTFVLTIAPPAAAQTPGPKVIQPDSVAFGKTYGQWSASWWQWALSLEAPANHPLFHNGAVDCTKGQAGAVWFLGGKFCANDDPNCGFSNIVRSCTVPSGKALFIAVGNVEDSKLEEPDPTKQIADLTQYAASNMDGANNLFFQLDGAGISHLKERFRVQSVAFGYTLPDNNVWKAVYPPNFPVTFSAGTYYPAVDDGVYVMLSPLTPGPHVLRFGGSFGPNFSFDVTYFLNVTN